MPASRKIEFPNADGEPLAAALALPDSPPRGYALFAHCFTCGKDIAAAARIARSLAAHGFGVLRFDFTGLGGSGGDFANSNFSSNVDDLVAAADYLDREHEAPVLLIGHSLGGTAILAAAARIPSRRARWSSIGAPAPTGRTSTRHFGEQPRHASKARRRGRRWSHGRAPTSASAGTSLRRSWKTSARYDEDLHRLDKRPADIPRAPGRRGLSGRGGGDLHRGETPEELRLPGRRRPSAVPPGGRPVCGRHHQRLGEALSARADRRTSGSGRR
ncbi:MAG: alpha/beta fold hydrolase [Gammaproteobacteria bacterium]|nr:alpha/beta fold hydrolase [Gammaproteobacteria bacterium]